MTPPIDSPAVLRADAAALAALRDWAIAWEEASVCRYPEVTGAQGLERRCRERAERALALAELEAEG